MDSQADRQPNAFQRRYFAWAAPYYARMPRPLAAEAERIDRWLYSRSGLPVWSVLASLMVANTVGLGLAGVPWVGAAAASVFAWLMVLFVILGAWLKADGATTPRLVRFVAIVLLLAYLGALVGFIVGHTVKHGGLDTGLPGALAAGLRDATPWLILLVATLGFLTWGVSSVKRFRVRREMLELRLQQERDSTARLLAEARLKLLQRQIQPHFIFNTLAAVQHWVDVADPRAGPLLRALTAFLRGTTALLATEQVAVAIEIETLRSYLSVMEARLGARLRYEIVTDPAAQIQTVPAGLLLTLVENAIEHGIAPALAGGIVRVVATDDGHAWTLCVSDDGVGLAPDWQEGIGFGNCRERLLQMFGARASITLESLDGLTVARVRIVRETPA